MKTPDEIKKGLEYCAGVGDNCDICPYQGCNVAGRSPACDTEMETDALAYIQQLEAKIAEYEKPLAPLTLEEIKTIRGVWVEGVGCPWEDDEPQPALWDGRVNGHFHQFIDKDYSYEEEYVYFKEVEYGKTWRCWSRKPTDEERKAVKWDD